MNVNRQDRLKLKGKTRNTRAPATTTNPDSKKQSTALRFSGNRDEPVSAPCAKKPRSCESLKRVHQRETADSTPEIDDIVMISDDEEILEIATRKPESKAEIMCPKIDDVSLLLTLRKQLLQIRPTVPANKHFEDLPAFTQINQTRETTVEAIMSIADEELSPLPPMCSWCRKRKPICQDEPSTSDDYQMDTDLSASILTNTESNNNEKITQIMTHSQHSSSKNISCDEKINSKNMKKATHRILADSKQLNFGTVSKPCGSKTDDKKSYSTGNGTEKRETIPFSQDKTSKSVEERGDNLFLRLSNKTTGYSAGKSRPKNSHVGSSKGSNSARVSNNEKQSGVDKSRTSSDRVDSKDERLKSCPLCQLDFENGMSQLDLDGHIAACLASAEDDIIW